MTINNYRYKIDKENSTTQPFKQHKDRPNRDELKHQKSIYYVAEGLDAPHKTRIFD